MGAEGGAGSACPTAGGQPGHGHSVGSQIPQGAPTDASFTCCKSDTTEPDVFYAPVGVMPGVFVFINLIQV